MESLTSASKVLIVPGYGLAVANAQHSIAELTKMLKKKGVEVGCRALQPWHMLYETTARLRLCGSLGLCTFCLPRSLRSVCKLALVHKPHKGRYIRLLYAACLPIG